MSERHVIRIGNFTYTCAPDTPLEAAHAIESVLRSHRVFGGRKNFKRADLAIERAGWLFSSWLTPNWHHLHTCKCAACERKRSLRSYVPPVSLTAEP